MAAIFTYPKKSRQGLLVVLKGLGSYRVTSGISAWLARLTLPPSRAVSLGMLAMLVFFTAHCAWGKTEQTPLYKDSNAPLEKRLDDLLGRLTEDEKLSLLTGTGFTTQPIKRLGVPAMSMVDAGQGVRGGTKSTQGPATAFPCGVAMASSWDVGLIQRIGKAIGEEVRNKGTGSQVLLGPAVNIQRSPLGGRNGEYFTEDPFLDAHLAAAYIQGVQSTGVAACVKHFACNNEEVDRGYVNVKIGERALREIYLPAFKAAVKKGKVRAVMSAYNKINGFHCSANAYLLTDVLKKGWGFDGLVMSDWGGVHQTPVAQAGNDLEMPGGKFATVDKLKAALANGSLTQAAVDDSDRRILRTVIRTGLLDHPAAPDASVINCKPHQQLARKAAEEGIVLLKNKQDLLPLDRRKVTSIAVIGKPATHMQVGALGSPHVSPFYTVEILDGIRKLAGKSIKVDDVDDSQGDYNAVVAKAIATAKADDIAVVCVGTAGTEGEGHDRPSMDLPQGQDTLIRAVAAVNPKTVVILNNGTPVTLSHWIKNVPALIETWFPGQEGGTALAAILFGDVNPSGKLPTTFAVARQDYPDFGHFPGHDGVVKYDEGIYVGYRYFDKKNIKPIFPFGYGLSYTTFAYSNLKLSQPTMRPDGSVQVNVDVTNTGRRGGDETVQLYIHDPKPHIDKPLRELKGFARVALQPGETKTVSLRLTPRDLAYFDVQGKQWKADAGPYDIELASSSRDIRQKTTLKLATTFTQAVPLSRSF